MSPNDVADANRSQINDPVAPTSIIRTSEPAVSTDFPDPPLFDVQLLPGKGRGLVAREDIIAGTRILCEQPIFLTSSYKQTADMESRIVAILKTITTAEQQQFLSFHNYFTGIFPMSGIVKTNALPCESDTSSGGIFATACLVNHSCVPNTNFNWDKKAQLGTIHAICNIKAGEEIAIDYNGGDPYGTRQIHLKQSFGFTCACQLCSSTTDQLLASDSRRIQIQRLRTNIRELWRLINEPEGCLADCLRLRLMQNEEYRGHAGGWNITVYTNAFKISIYHGDRARAHVFAHRAYRLRVWYQGHDHPDTRRSKRFIEQSIDSFQPESRRWETAKNMVPRGLDVGAFERWLWRQEV